MKNAVKEKLATGKQVLGCFIGIYAPNIVEIIGYAGYDFIVIDDEHGAFSHSELEQMIRAADSVGLVPLVRVSYDPSSIQKALDRGAKGVQVPMVNTKADAIQAVQRAKFPPKGTRGAAYSHRAARFGKDSGAAFLNASDDHIMIIPHIETLEAAENFESIMSVEGIDMAFIGTTDLSVNMGYKEAGPMHPDVQKVVSDLYAKAAKKDMPIGTVAANAEGAKRAFAQGASYVSVVALSVILQSLEDLRHACQYEEKRP
ncbi:hypothetical protein G4V62_12245 [Bacillaceae bacterium SIJ1]|uniref:HpcH/HpaI aldolase family protein n=1 Tax=Litoribacterium kuwaitense TaxID=1398745 RepID=UPI0013EBA722|nr:aldolase/citrate lyase family protein [Litoribacterium kuwaitense]NGP45689.1 hypothetical protein [Litoribacterium kuwaitense]